jgi:hypothetical protein
VQARLAACPPRFQTCATRDINRSHVITPINGSFRVSYDAGSEVVLQ